MKKKATPFFSVIITTYNRSELLKRALNSLLAQTEDDWEAIIVDDESTDNTHNSILPYLERYPAMRYVRQAHQGEAAAKNCGLAESTGRFITFLDSDDEFKPTHLETRKIAIESDPSIKFIYGGVKILGNQFVPDRFNYGRQVNLNDCIIGGTFFIDRNLALSLKGFRLILVGADADLFDRARKKHIKMTRFLQQTYIYHHDTEDSITNMIFQGQ